MKFIILSLLIIWYTEQGVATPASAQEEMRQISDQLSFYMNRISYARYFGNYVMKQATIRYGRQFRDYLRWVSHAGNNLEHMVDLIPSFGMDNERNVEQAKNTLVYFLSRMAFGGQVVSEMIRTIPARRLRSSQVKAELRKYLRQVSVAGNSMIYRIERLSNVDTMPEEMESIQRDLATIMREVPVSYIFKSIMDSFSEQPRYDEYRRPSRMSADFMLTTNYGQQRPDTRQRLPDIRPLTPSTLDVRYTSKEPVNTWGVANDYKSEDGFQRPDSIRVDVQTTTSSELKLMDVGQQFPELAQPVTENTPNPPITRDSRYGWRGPAVNTMDGQFPVLDSVTVATLPKLQTLDTNFS